MVHLALLFIMQAMGTHNSSKAFKYASESFFSIFLNKKYLYIEVTGCNSYGDYRAKIDIFEIMGKGTITSFISRVSFWSRRAS